jgi:hypothetical protein
MSVPPPSPPLTPAQEAEIVRRYLAGEQTARIAAALGVGTSRLYRVLRENGVERRRPVSPRRTRVRPPIDDLINFGRAVDIPVEQE